MRLKLEGGNAVLQDGKPVYVKDDGSEVTVDAAALFARISALNGEAKSHRESKEAAEAALQVERDRASGLESRLHAELIGGAFARSKIVAEKFALQGPAAVEMAQALFGKHFSLKDGSLVATNAKGERIMSAALERVGQPADFEEALEAIVEAYPHKASLLKGDVKGGTGSTPSSGGGTSQRTLSRSAFQSLAPSEQRAHLEAGGVVTE